MTTSGPGDRDSAARETAARKFAPCAPPDPGRLQIAGALGWSVIVFIGGGFVCGMLIDRFGELGSLSLWALGWLAGSIARKILGAAHRPTSYALVAACCFAAILAETFWIRLHIANREDWVAAASYLPTFVQNYQFSAALAALWTGLGAYSAYEQTARNYILMRVPLD